MSTQFLISTVSTNVTISDLGLVLTHPVVDRDLALEFTAEDIAASEDLTAAIQSGSLIVKITTAEYGEYQIDADEYTSFSLLEQALPSFEKEEFLTESEIEATYLDSFIREGIFPAVLSSTTAVTNVVVSTSATFQDWRVAPNDIIGIFGTTTSDGYFTVQSITNQTTLVTEEALNTTSGVGTFAIYNPVGAKRVGVDDTNFTVISGTDAQSVFESIDLNMVQDLDDLGDVDVSTNPPLDGYVLEYDGYQWAPISVTTLIEDEHRSLDQLVHEIAEDAYTEYSYTGNQVTNITTYTDSGKTTKIREEEFTYSGTRVDTAVTIQYDGAGTIVERLTETFTYSGTQVISVDSVLEEF